jgi:phosphoribosyl 1,2-cyclic phosphate phosphodiesterase
MKITVLGSGTSQGVPVIGCSCPVCKSSDSRDQRMRSSLYVEGSAGERAVIDTGPEFRLQALQAEIAGLDAVFLTHAHADHIHGLDDIRPLSREKPIPLYGNRGTIAEFKARFSYIFKAAQQGGGKPQIKPIIAKKPINLGMLTFIPIPVKHGKLDILGWKITEAGPGNARTAVYLTDCTHIDVDVFRLLAEGGEPALVIIDGLRVRPHDTHFNFEQALNAGLQMGARKILLTHICHEHTHREIADYCSNFAEKAELPSVSMGPAWDGLRVEL